MNPRLLVAGAAAVLAYLATWALMIFVCLLRATKGSTSDLSGVALGPNIAPDSWSLRAVYLAVAILVGFLTFRACREWDLSLRQATVPAGLALALVLVVSGTRYADGVSNEHSYLRHVPPGMSHETALAYGHQACDWLGAQRWGKPRLAGEPDTPAAYLERAKRLARLVHDWRWGKWHWAESTVRLMGYYVDQVDAQHPGPLTQKERQQVSVLGSAWFELCPFQQWVHRPVGGSAS